MAYNNNINPDFICLYTNMISKLNFNNYVEEMHLKLQKSQRLIDIRLQPGATEN